MSHEPAIVLAGETCPAEAERDALRAALQEVLSALHERVHPGYPARRGTVSEETYARLVALAWPTGGRRA